jgi:hypothetical protein
MRLPIIALLLAIAPTAAVAQVAADGPLCTDRPSRSNNVCTVPAGRIQIESDLGVWTRDDAGGVRTDSFVYLSPTVKLGVDRATDVQVAFTPHAETRTRDAAGVSRVGGFGDVFLRVKRRITAEGAKLQIGAIPFIKAPTAKRGVGNGAWEGGVSVPIQYELPSGFSLGFSPEVDLILDADGRGRHAQIIGTANVARTLGDRANVGVELWTAQDFDPTGTGRQYTADVFATWLATPRLQLDAGANFGLNRQTPNAQVYVGFSTRF